MYILFYFPMRILLTGAAGFIGSHVADRLIALEHDVIGIDNFSDYYSPEIKKKNIAHIENHPRYTIKKVDITDAASVSDLFEERSFDAIIHLAAQPGVRASIENPLRTQKVNIEGTMILFEAAKKYGVKKIVFASSSSVYGGSAHIPFQESESLTTPLSPYAATKQACELLAYTYHALYRIDMVGLRFFTVYGERGRPDMSPYLFIDAIHNGKELTQFGDGSSERDFTYISDIVDGVVASLEKVKGYEIINLGNSDSITLREYIALLENIIGKKASIVQKSPQPGEMPKTYADITKANALLDWKPRVSLETGLQNMVHWYMDL